MIIHRPTGSRDLRHQAGLCNNGRVNERTRRPVVHPVAGIALMAALVWLARPAAQSGSFVNGFLREQMKFSAADLRALEAGRAVINTLDTPVRQEIAHFGVVYVNAPSARFLERFRDIERFERGPGVPQLARFSNPASIADAAGLTLPAEDVKSLSTCRPARCDVKLTAAAMKRFRSEVNWRSSTASDQATRIVREMLVDLVRAYEANGNRALGEYIDGGEPLGVADQFRALLTSLTGHPAPVPALFTYLNNYPGNRPAGAEDLFYWSVVNFGLKPTIRVNHVVIYPLGAGAPYGVSHVIAIKQLYASHYFHTTLELRFLVNDPRRGGFYLLSITRARTDGMTGLGGLLVRPIVSRRSREAVRGYLEHVKRQVERPGPPSPE
jgi:hypothetical protein